MIKIYSCDIPKIKTRGYVAGIKGSGCGAPKGNKYAVGHGWGRPRQYDHIEEAKAFLEWAQKPDSLILRKFAAERGYPAERLYRMKDENEDFRQAFLLASDLVGIRREEMLLDDRSSIPYNKYAAMHDEALHVFERLEKKFDANLKKEETAVDPALLQQFAEFMGYIKKMQQPQSALSIDDNSNSAEVKS